MHLKFVFSKGEVKKIVKVLLLQCPCLVKTNFVIRPSTQDYNKKELFNNVPVLWLNSV